MPAEWGEAERLSFMGERWVLVATILASGIVFLQSTVVNVALPAIGKSLGTGLSGLQWIVDGYVLTLAALLILGGSLGDRYGRRRLMVIGLAGFGLSSLACGLAPSLSWLIGVRLVQGAAGALMVPGSLALLRVAYPAGEERGQAIGQWSGWSGIATVVGPLIGGWLVQTFSWRWAFFVILPLVVVCGWLLVGRVPESRDEEAAGPLDWRGAVLVTASLGGLAYGLTEGPAVGWTTGTVLLGLLGGALALALFVLVEDRTDSPMVRLSLFRSPNFTGANLTTLAAYFALYGATFFLVIYLQNVMGYSPLAAGMILAPISLLMLVLSPRFGRLAGRHGPRLFMSLGPLVFGAGLVLLVRIHAGASVWTGVLPAVLVLGLGLAATVAPLTNTVISAVPDRESGLAAAINNAVSRAAALLAIAGLGVVLSLTFDGALQSRINDLSLSQATVERLHELTKDPAGSANLTGLPAQARQAVERSYTVAFHRTMLTAAGVAALGGMAAALTIRNPAGRGGNG